MVDVSLVFPPQWSPFQPALSLAALSAWLRREGLSVRSHDMNLAFFRYLLTDADAAGTLFGAGAGDHSEPKIAAYRHMMQLRGSLLEELVALQNDDSTDILTDHYLFNKKASTYLALVSSAQDDFDISLHSFELKSGRNNSLTALNSFIENPGKLIEVFINGYVDLILESDPHVVGISCIGQEQLPFTLLYGSLIKKRRPSVLIVVGGTILPRIESRSALPSEWFKKCFDYIICNEGERPLTELVIAAKEGDIDKISNIPSVISLCNNGKPRRNRPSKPLIPEEMPLLDFDDYPLGEYFSAKTTLPLLSSRGCYWGKCEFCHHGMVYGEKYTSYTAGRVWDEIQQLSRKYGVKHFAFNDEAIPPKILRSMGEVFQPSEVSGFHFTGLIKFERYFTQSDFDGAARAGFRTMYVGLESASERVLASMKKRTLRSTIVDNLRSASQAGIWMHCFLFFGFPGETNEDAQETYDFVIENSDIVNSFGAGVFMLEHDAPIHQHMDNFGLEPLKISDDSVSVFYNFSASSGITRKEAARWQNRLNENARNIPGYLGLGWIPREQLVFLVSVLGAEGVKSYGKKMALGTEVPGDLRLAQLLSYTDLDDQRSVFTSIIDGKVRLLSGKARDVFRSLVDANPSISEASGLCGDKLQIVL